MYHEKIAAIKLKNSNYQTKFNNENCTDVGF